MSKLDITTKASDTINKYSQRHYPYHTVRLCPKQRSLLRLEILLIRTQLVIVLTLIPQKHLRQIQQLSLNQTLANYYGDNDILTSAFDNTNF